jgi:hypothetical protein
MSDSENHETTFNHFLLHFLRYSCNFCPNTCTQEAKLIKVSHLGVVTLPMWMNILQSTKCVELAQSPLLVGSKLHCKACSLTSDCDLQ